MKLVRINGQKDLAKDEDTGAVLNTDTDGFKQYKKMKRFKSNQRDEIEKMKQDIEEIKSLLKEIAKK